MHSESDSMEIMINDNVEEVIEEHFQLPLSRYQIGLATSLEGNNFVFDCVHLLYFKCHEANPNGGGSYVNSPDRIKSKKETINPINKKISK